jgi:Raf kinase inhibitor-like YbhB/YbcL family protein
MSMALIPLSSSAFVPGGDIPVAHTCDGPDASPPLEWGEPPAGTRSFALICDDPDAPMGTWVHWVLFNLPAQTRSLSEKFPTDGELPTGARQGKNGFGRLGYGGPCPPKGPAHRYFFKLYALDGPVSVAAGAGKEELEAAMKGHVLAQGELMGRYGRR